MGTILKVINLIHKAAKIVEESNLLLQSSLPDMLTLAIDHPVMQVILPLKKVCRMRSTKRQTEKPEQLEHPTAHTVQINSSYKR